jgi:hypothetical protein
MEQSKTFVKLAIWITVICLCAIYWAGILSGYYGRHYTPSNSDPDTFIHGGLFHLSAWLFGYAVLTLYEWRVKRKMLKLSHGLIHSS